MSEPFSPVPGSTVNITVAATTSDGTLNVTPALSGSQQVRVMNDGTATVWIQFGASGVAATLAASLPVPAGGVEVLTVPPGSYVAAIAAGSTGKIYFTRGMGI